MSREFSIVMPSVLFGSGTRRQVGKELKKYDCTKVFIMCDAFLNQNGKAKELADICAGDGIEAVIYEAGSRMRQGL